MKIASNVPSNPPAAPTAPAKPQDQVSLPTESFHAQKSGTDFGEIGGFLVKTLGPVGAITGGLATLAATHVGTGTAVAVTLGVPVAYGAALALKDSLVSPKPGAEFGRAVLVGGGIVGGALGAWAGSHFGSAVVGAAVGALAPAAATFALLGGLRLASAIHH